MSRRSQDKLSRSSAGWEKALSDAERQVQAARARLTEMEAALEVCRERVASGQPFPGENRLVSQSKEATA